MKLPARMSRISERLVTPEHQHIFKWVEPAKIEVEYSLFLNVDS